MFEVRYVTHLFLPPDHTVTVRNGLDGWDTDVDGQYQGDAWVFTFDEERYGPLFTFKFVLDGIWMMGNNLTIEPDSTEPAVYAGDTVRFPGVRGSDPSAAGAVQWILARWRKTWCRGHS